jgi:ribulose-5-phosphate 4-epimerase/fuculose-1-phosphate aldolase
MAFSPAEWRARQQLAACFRVFEMLGWTELVYNHVSLRVPGPYPHFLINPFGLNFGEIKASNLVKVDLDGTVQGRSDWGVNPAGVVLHSALYANIPHAQCVMQSYTTNGMAVAGSAQGVTMTSFYAAQLAGRLAYHDTEGLILRADEAARLAQALRERPAAILRGHGLLAWDESLPKAFCTLWALQRACDAQVAGAALGPSVPVPEAVQRRCAEDAARLSGDAEFAASVFEALVRQADGIDTSWRE